MTNLPFDKPFIEAVTKQYPSPFHLYDERAIKKNAERLFASFKWVPARADSFSGYQNFFAVKALPNPHILKILADFGMGFDCSSLAELELCSKIGIDGRRLFFTSNNTKAEEYARARELGAIINLDDITHIDFLNEVAGLPDLLCFRYNPGALREGNALIGKPEEAKYGLTRDQLFEAYAAAKKLGVKHFGLHTMVASNELNGDYFIETARMLFDLALEIHQKLGISFEFVNLGGGIGTPYRPEQKAVDYAYVSAGVEKLYREKILETGLHPLPLVTENGRVVTGPYGYLVTRTIHEKHIYREYIGVDACMANLMRPGMYGAYHHISVLGKEKDPAEYKYDVVGSLCENNDKFAVDRLLPKVEIGDFLVIHNTGAHGHAMGFNYNGKLRSAELLLREDGTVKLIRRAETLQDHFATLDFSEFK